MNFKNNCLCLLTLLVLQKASAQAEWNAVVKKVETYKSLNGSEKLFIHTDKENYVAGDIVWFKVYRLAGANTGNQSKVTYVELLSASNQPLLQVKIALNDKSGSGSLQLPLTASTGYYKLRTYTNQMKNAGKESFFEKEITIINTLKTPEPETAASSKPFSIRLFPEGGHLVNGLPARVAFRLTDENEKAADGRGFLINQNNDTLATFRPSIFGMGTFQFTPRAGQSYKVVFLLSGNALAMQELPAVEQQGYVLAVEDADNNRIKITATSNTTSPPEVFLLGQTKQQVFLSQRLILQNGIGSYYVNKNDIKEGVSQFTLFNSEKVPVCERLYFKQPALSKTLQVSTNQSQYNRRSTVQLNTPVTANEDLSLSVFRLDSLQSAPQNINYYYWLTSELNGTVENPEYYFSRDAGVHKAADLLMMTNGWRSYDWKNIFDAKPGVFAAETVGQVIRAKLTDPQTNRGAAGIPLFLSIPDTYYKLYSATTDSAGVAEFTVPEYFGHSEIILQTRFAKDAQNRIQVLSPFSESFTAPLSRKPVLQPRERKLLEEYSISMQSQHVYIPDSITRFSGPVVQDTFPFYGTPISRYSLDDYRRFRTMEEVLREYVREINVGVKGSGAGLRLKLFNEDNRNLYTEDILVTLDGVPLQNPDQIFQVDPLKIKNLDIITKNFILGSSVFHGMANFASYEGKFQDLNTDPSGVVIDYEGLQLQRQFYSPDYGLPQSKNRRIPDLRTTLFWSPAVSGTKTEFYTGDNRGNYLVVLQGLGTDGQPVFATTTFSVN